MRLALLSFAALVSAPTFALSQSTQPTELIRQLSDDQWRTREAAQAALVQLGDDAVAALSATTQQAADEEACSRAAGALSQIEEDKAIGPSRITLHLHDVTAKQAFTELSRQAGAPLEPVTPSLWQQLPPATVSIDVDHLPFWSAIPMLSDRTNLWLQQWGSGLRLNNGGPLMPGPRCVSGPLLVIADSLERSQSITFASNPTHADTFRFHTLVMAEPKLHVLRADSSLQLTEAIDDHDNSLLVTNAPAHGSGFAVESAAWNGTAELAFPALNPGTRIKSIRGTVGITLVSKSQKFELKVPGNAPSVFQSGGGSITLLNGVKLPNGRVEYTLQIVAAGTGPAAHEWAGHLTRGNALLLYDASGHAFARDSSQISSDGRTFNLTLRFNSLTAENGETIGEPDHFGGDLVIATKELALPFSFADLPMP